MRFALGTAQFGMTYGIANTSGQVTQEKAHEILRFCKTIGIDVLDTAISYGDSEECLGNFGVNNFNLITKLPLIPESTKDIDNWIRSEIEASISRLKIETIYGLMLHRPKQLLNNQGNQILNSLDKLKESGKIKKVGVSVYSPEELKIILNLYDFDIVQVPFNLIDRRLVSSGWLNRLNKKGVEVHARSAFLQGLLLMKRNEIPEKFKRWDNIWDEWHDWLKMSSISPIESCISYVLSYADVNKIVLGVENVHQLQEIIEAKNKEPEILSFPEISSNDIKLINPSNWNSL